MKTALLTLATAGLLALVRDDLKTQRAARMARQRDHAQLLEALATLALINNRVLYEHAKQIGQLSDNAIASAPVLVGLTEQVIELRAARVPLDHDC